MTKKPRPHRAVTITISSYSCENICSLTRHSNTVTVIGKNTFYTYCEDVV